jgi:succinate dehydrogenase / fumarate reductase, cytochrome b subunit
VIAARAIETLVAVMTIGAGFFALYIMVDLLRLRKSAMGPIYKGGVGQWSWVAHRITGVGVVAFLYAHIIDTFAVGFGPELYNETVSLYKQWWFTPFEVLLVGAVLFHALNGLRIILFDFWPGLAQKQKHFAVAETVLFLAGFIPSAIFMLGPAVEKCCEFSL